MIKDSIEVESDPERVKDMLARGKHSRVPPPLPLCAKQVIILFNG